MAEINFLPVCSACKKIIYEAVNFGYEADFYCDNTVVASTKPAKITPNICPYCGNLFTRITMPSRLPFDPNSYK